MKIPDNLAEMYATLTAKMPEMVVDVPPTCDGAAPQRLLHTYGQWCLWPWLHGRSVGTGQGRTAHEAATLIRSHWEESLPDGCWLLRCQDEPHIVDYSILTVSRDEDDMMRIDQIANEYPDPITALYHYHMGRGA